MTMKKNLLLALAGCCAFPLFAQNTVWFDEPTSLKGRSPWYGGHPERFADGRKPIDAGGFNGNADHEWE